MNNTVVPRNTQKSGAFEYLRPGTDDDRLEQLQAGNSYVFIPDRDPPVRGAQSPLKGYWALPKEDQVQGSDGRWGFPKLTEWILTLGAEIKLKNLHSQNKWDGNRSPRAVIHCPPDKESLFKSKPFETALRKGYRIRGVHVVATDMNGEKNTNF